MTKKSGLLITMAFISLLTGVSIEYYCGPTVLLSVANGASTPSGLHHPLETADPTSAECLRFLQWTDQAVANPQYPPFGFSAFHAALAFKLTGKATYANLAMSMVDQTVNAAKSAAASANPPAITYDTYSGAFAGIKDVTFTLQWCDSKLTATQRSAWRDYCTQASYNLRNPRKAKWYGKSFPITGMPNSGDSLFYRHLGANACWAVYSGDTNLINWINSSRWATVVNNLTRLPEGGSFEGTAFGLNQRDLFEVYGIWKASTGTDVQSKTTHCRNSMLYWVHATTPDGKFHAPIGDQEPVPNASIDDSIRMIINSAMNQNPGDAGAAAGRWWTQAYYPKLLSGYNFPYELQLTAGTATRPTALSYFAKGAGHYFARSSWSTAASYLNFTCGPLDQSRGHENHGSFDLWGAGGWLTVTENTLTGSGDHGTPNFHNMLRFEKSGASVNQRLGTAGKATVVDDGTTLVADMNLSALYPNQGITWSRNLTYGRPGTLTVTDNYTVTTGTVPIFQLQLPVAPVVTSNGLTAGKLKVTVVTPTLPSITVQDWTKLSTDALTGYRVNISDPANGGQFVVKLEVLQDTVPGPPPTLAGLHHPLETASATSTEGVRFLNWVDYSIANPQEYRFAAFHAALAYKLTAQSKYANQAIAMVEKTIADAKTSAKSGTQPAIANDSYYGVFDGMRDVTYTLQWCGALLTEAQKTDWGDYCRQAIANVWNPVPTTSTWYGKTFPWSGWSQNNPGNNYYYGFLGATACWANYSGDAAWLDYLKSDRFPKVRDYMITLPDGGSREGTAYGLAQFYLFEVYGIWAMSTGEDLQSQSTHCRNSILYWTHATTPGGKFFAPIGDQARVSNAPVYDFNRTLIDAAVNLNASHPNAEVGRWWGKTYYPKMQHGFNCAHDMLNIAGTATAPTALIYKAPATGHYFARSDWTDQATFLDFICGTYDESHGHHNHGGFDFWGAGGWLAVTANTFMNSGIRQKPQFHNVIRFEKSGAVLPQEYRTSGIANVTDDGKTLAADLDLTPMYLGLSWKRKLTYTRPSVLLIEDVYTVPSGVVPIFQLQLPVQPTLTTNGFTAGKLKGTVLTPTQPTMSAQDWRAINTDPYPNDGLSGWRVNITDPAVAGKFVVKLEVQSGAPTPAGITVSTISGNTTEAGGKATFNVTLDSQPTADVTIGISSNDTTEGTLSVSSLIFTSANWNTPQVVTVTGVDDTEADGNVSYAILTAAATSTDALYNGLNAADVSAINSDNDAAGITVSAISGNTTEAGGKATFSVALNSKPTANVTIGLSSNDTTEGTLSVASLAFALANWNTPQVVTVTGVDDAVVDGNVGYSIVTAAAVSTDAGYNGLNAADVSVINLDNDSTPAQVRLHHPLETASPTSTEGVRFLNWVDYSIANPQEYRFAAFHAALAYKLTAQSKYANQAIAMVEKTIADAKTSAKSGTQPAIANDSYYGVFDGMRDVTYTLQWCGALLTEAQKTDWGDYCRQAIANVWNPVPTTSTWYGKTFPWSGWSQNNPGNNYYYGFLGATACWANYSGDAAWLDYLKSDRFPKVRDYMITLPDGGSREGTAYGLAQFYLFEVYGIWAMSTGEDLQSQSTHCRNSILYWTHATTPGGKFFAPIGDQARVSNAPVYDFNRTLIDAAVNLNASHPNAEVGRWWGKTYYPKMQHGFNCAHDMLNIAGTATAPTALIYKAPATGHYFARSDWTDQATFLDFICGTYDESHGHHNHGGFDFWGAGGWLAVTANTFMNSGIRQKPQFHNVIRFEKSGAVLPQEYRTSGIANVTDDGKTLAADLDLTPMYLGLSWKRKLTYTRPSVLLIEDVYTVPSGVVPIFQLQLPVQPTLTTNGFTAGKLKGTVLTPTQPTMSAQDWRAINTDPYPNDGLSGWRLNIFGPAGTGAFSVKLEVIP